MIEVFIAEDEVRLFITFIKFNYEDFLKKKEFKLLGDKITLIIHN